MNWTNSVRHPAVLRRGADMRQARTLLINVQHCPIVYDDPLRLLANYSSLGMSIYRTLNRTPLSDVYQTAEHSVPVGSAQPRVVFKAAQPLDWTGHRRAKPADAMLRITAAWVERLPPNVRPHALCARFARIANALANLWYRPEACKAYIDDLLTDRRGGRKGFPQDVLNDLQALKAFYASLTPEARDIWEDSHQGK